MNFLNRIKLITACAMLFLITAPAVYAQPGFEDDVNDEPDAGIASYTASLLIAACAGYYLTQKTKTSKS
jgi:hypothetical protein